MKIFRIPVFCIIAICFLLFSCGKKGPPTLKSFETPEAPANLRAVHREDKIILSWSYKKKDNLKGFHILKSFDTDFQRIAFVSKDDSTFIDSDIKAGGSYKYKIAAQSMRDLLSNDSNVIAISPSSSPLPPKKLSFKAENDSLTISWENAGENISYNIYKSFKKGEYGTNPINKKAVRTVSYSDSLDPDRPVYYTVRSLNESKAEGFASDEIEVSPENFIPSRPKGLQAVLTEDSIVLIWNENPEKWITKYKIYQKTEDKGDFKMIGESLTPAFTGKAKKGVKYTYRVTAVGPISESEASKTITVDF